MEKITFSSLSDLDKNLTSKLVRFINNQKVNFKCPKCGLSFGNYSVSYWLSHSQQTCKQKDCGEKTHIDSAKIREMIRTVEKA